VAHASRGVQGEIGPLFCGHEERDAQRAPARPQPQRIGAGMPRCQPCTDVGTRSSMCQTTRPCCKPLPVLDVRTLKMHRKPHSRVEQCESTVLAPAPAWCKRALAVETGQHGPGLHGPRPVCHARAGWGTVRGGESPGLHVPRHVLPCSVGGVK